MRVVELTEALHVGGVTERPPLNDELDRFNRQSHHPSHLEVRVGENNPIPLEEEILPKMEREEEEKSMTSIYKFEKNDPKDKDWEKKLEGIIEKKIRSCMKKKSLLDLNDIVIDSHSFRRLWHIPTAVNLRPHPLTNATGVRTPYIISRCSSPTCTTWVPTMPLCVMLFRPPFA